MPNPLLPDVYITGGTTFGVAKLSLCRVAYNGIGSNDPRVMQRTNEATEELLKSTDPRTGGPLIPVGGMFAVALSTDANGVFTLPKEMENVISHYVVPPGSEYGKSDTSQGWHNIVNPFTYVDPTMVHDNPLIDFGLVPDPFDPTILRRRYADQGVSGVSTIVVTGKKRYIPITSDNASLIIQNVPALKMMIQAIERRENVDIDNALKYKAEAIKMISDEVVNHLMDATDAMRRMSDYKTDLATFAVGTYGNTRARLAMEVPNLMSKGRAEIGYLLNQAVREAVDHRNFLGRSERYTFIAGSNQLNFARSEDPAAVLVYSDFEVLRLLVIAQQTPPEGVQPPPTSNPAREQAFALIERDLAALIEAQRLDYYRGIAVTPEDTFIRLTSRIGLEVPGMLELSLNQVSDAVLQAEREAIDHHNFLGRTERYSLEDGPNQLTYVTPATDEEPLVYSNFEVIRLLVLAQRTPPAGVEPPKDATPPRAQAFQIIERDMAAEAESARTAAHLAALGLYPKGSRGWTVARIGLELPIAIQYTVNRLAGAVDRAEMRLMERGTFKGCLEEFNATIVNGHIHWPARVETVLAIVLCGQPTSIRSMFYKYVKDGPGQECCTCNGRFEDEGDKYFPNSGDRRRVYRALIDGEGTKVTAVCKLRWVVKANTDQMTIQSLEALGVATAGILTGQADAAIASAESILQKQLREYTAGLEKTFPNLSYALGVGDLGGVL